MACCHECEAVKARVEALEKSLDILRANTQAVRGMFQMLICECDHKQHAHEDNTGYCDRCGCTSFKERQ